MTLREPTYLKDMKRILLALGLAVGLVSCGGTGSPLVARMQSFLAALNAENITSVMNSFSVDYFHDGQDWFDERDFWLGIFSAPGYSVRFSQLDVTDEQVSEPFGFIDGFVHFREDDNGFITEGDIPIGELFGVGSDTGMFYIREGGVWRFYGNQLVSKQPNKARSWGRSLQKNKGTSSDKKS